MLTNLKGTQNRFVTGVSNNFRMTFSTLNSFPYETISDFLNEWSTNNENFVNMIHNLSMHMFCGTNSCEHKFLYDSLLLKIQEVVDTEVNIRMSICAYFSQTTFADEEITAFEDALAVAFPKAEQK